MQRGACTPEHLLTLARIVSTISLSFPRASISLYIYVVSRRLSFPAESALSIIAELPSAPRRINSCGQKRRNTRQNEKSSLRICRVDLLVLRSSRLSIPYEILRIKYRDDRFAKPGFEKNQNFFFLTMWEISLNNFDLLVLWLSSLWILTELLRITNTPSGRSICETLIQQKSILYGYERSSWRTFDLLVLQPTSLSIPSELLRLTRIQYHDDRFAKYRSKKNHAFFLRIWWIFVEEISIVSRDYPEKSRGFRSESVECVFGRGSRVTRACAMRRPREQRHHHLGGWESEI